MSKNILVLEGLVDKPGSEDSNKVFLIKVLKLLVVHSCLQNFVDSLLNIAFLQHIFFLSAEFSRIRLNFFSRIRSKFLEVFLNRRSAKKLFKQQTVYQRCFTNYKYLKDFFCCYLFCSYKAYRCWSHHFSNS